MSRGLRALMAASLAGGLLLVCLAWPGIVLQTILLPVATVLWLLLRLFVLSIDQHVYWWGIVAVAAMLMAAVLLGRLPTGRASFHAVPAPPGDPARRWRDSLRLGLYSDPAQDAFRREVAWMLASLYASQRPGFAAYQIREALVDRRIKVPKPVYDFLFSDTMPRARQPFFRNPVLWLRRTAESAERALQVASRGRGGRAVRDYLESVSTVLDFMEESQEMNNEGDTNA